MSDRNIALRWIAAVLIALGAAVVLHRPIRHPVKPSGSGNTVEEPAKILLDPIQPWFRHEELAASAARPIDILPPLSARIEAPTSVSYSQNPNSGTFTLTWSGASDPSGIATYNVRRSNDGGSTWLVVSTGVPTRSLAQSGVTQGIYVYQVRATDTVGWTGAWSTNTNTVSVDQTPPPTPTSAPDLNDSSDAGSSTVDNVTNVTRPVFTGTVEPNATARLYADAVLVGSATTNSGGNYSVTASALAVWFRHPGRSRTPPFGKTRNPRRNPHELRPKASSHIFCSRQSDFPTRRGHRCARSCRWGLTWLGDGQIRPDHSCPASEVARPPRR